MGHSATDISRTVHTFLERKARAKGLGGVEMRDDLNFIDEAVIDSLEFIELITLVEDEHGVQVDLSPYEPEVFYTVGGFARCVAGEPAGSTDVAGDAAGEIRYRLLERDDALWPAVRTLLVAQYRELHARFDPRALSAQEDLDRVFDLMHAATGRTDVVIAAVADDGEAKGFIWGTLRTTRATAERLKRAQWIECYVREEVRGTGVAQSLYSELERWFRAHGVGVIEADVNVTNARSHAYMASCGYTDYTLRMHKYLDADVAEPNRL